LNFRGLILKICILKFYFDNIDKIKKMKPLLIVFSFLFLISGILKADIPIFDVVTISVDDKVYYIQYETRGLLKEGKLEYYSYKGEFLGTVAEHVDHFLRFPETELFLNLDVINSEKFSDFTEPDSEKKLFFLKNIVVIPSKEILGNYEIISAVNGNTFGYICSQDLNELDNYWIKDYPIKLLFTFSDYEICDMALYGIEGNLSNKDVQIIKERIDKELKSQNQEEFKKILSELYKRNIIMIGFCSC
jgi:hypothetical protein